MIKIYTKISFLALFILLSACSQDGESEYLAKVGGSNISSEEFTVRYQFNPYLHKYPNPYQAKKVILTSLIAEKILAQEAKANPALNDHMHRMIFQHQKESMIENYRVDMVEKKITISENDLKHEYQKACKEVDIQYIAFDSFESAKTIYDEINSGASFENSTREYMRSRGWNDQNIPERTVTWNTESYGLEELIYNLKVNQTSEPVMAYGSYYLIRIVGTKRLTTPSSADFTNRLSALRDRISRYKIEKKYGALFHEKIEPGLGSVNMDLINRFLEQLALNEVEVFQRDNPPLQDKNGLAQELYVKSSDLLKHNLNNTVVDFPDGSSWNMKDLIDEMKYGPYGFLYKSPRQFKQSFTHNINLALEFEALYKLAQNANYDSDERVQKDVLMWENYYRATDHRYQVINKAEKRHFSELDHQSEKPFSNNSEIQLFRVIYFDEYVSGLLDKYPVDINTDLYNGLDLDKKDIVLMKSHFSNRMVSPLLEPLDGLPRWKIKMDSLTARFGIG